LLGLFRAKSLRPFLRVCAISWWTSGMLFVLVMGMWLATPWPKWRLRWRNRVVRRWARGMARIVGMRIRVVGEPPTPPFFLVANHLGYADIVVLLATVGTVFVAKHELNHWPVVGYLNRLVGTIFLDRASARDAHRVQSRIESRIQAGDGIAAFPEGTSSDGGAVQPMKAALFQWPAQQGYPVHVATIHYQTGPGLPPAREVVCWWGDMTFVPHVVELCRLPGFDATIRFGDQPIRGNDRSELAVRAREVIAANFVSHASGAS
jgi:1-acyl-sn-glycerol-3-phosphate acyltransferase